MGLQSGGGASTRVGLPWEGGAAVSRLQLVRAALLKGLGFSGRAGLQLGRDCSQRGWGYNGSAVEECSIAM